MATGYEINFTDLVFSASRSFQLAPYTTNGPVNPNTDSLDAKASGAASTLLLYGKGSPDYGERIQENMLHLLENFASTVEPVRPVGGQLWFDRSLVPAQARVYDPLRHLAVINTSVLPPYNTPDWIGIEYNNATEKAALEARFNALVAASATVRITDSLTGDQYEHLIVAVTDVAGGGQDLVSIQITPTPSFHYGSTGNHYVGGWEYVLQNNTPLYEDLNAGTWAITNLKDPVDDQDAATKIYVDTEIATAIAIAIAGNNSLDELEDVTITPTVPGSPPDVETGSILVYSAGQWRNEVPSATPFLPLTGGTLTGPLTTAAVNLGGTMDVGGNAIINIPTPTAGSQAVNKDYVDLATGTVSITALQDIPDVTYTGPGSPPTANAGDFLVYQGVVWNNIAPENTPFLIRTAPTGSPPEFGTMLRDLVLSGAGHQNPGGLAATENFVSTSAATAVVNANAYTDSQIALLPAEDYVVSGSFDPVLEILTLNRLLGGVVPIAASGLVVSSGVNHTLLDPGTDPRGDQWLGGFAFEERFGPSGSPLVFPPVVTVAEALNQLNILLGGYVVPKQRMIFTANGSGTLIYMDDTSGGAQPSQMNPTGAIDFSYHVGQHTLSVYANGVKQYISEPGYRIVYGVKPDGTSLYTLSRNAETGLTIGAPYSFDIDVNGAGAVTINVNGVATLGELVDAINAVADANYWQSGTPDSDYAFGVRILNGYLQFFSGLPGAGSTIDLTDISLFSAISGPGSPAQYTFPAPINGGGGTGEPTAPDANYAPANYGYKEVGRHGEVSQLIEFISAPPGTAVIEIIVEPYIFGEPNI